MIGKQVTPQGLLIENDCLDGYAAHEPQTDRSSDEPTVDAVLKGMVQFRVLNTCLYQSFRADLADRAEARIH